MPSHHDASHKPRGRRQRNLNIDRRSHYIRNSQRKRREFPRRNDRGSHQHGRNSHRPRMAELPSDRRADEIHRSNDRGSHQHGRNSHRPRMGELSIDRRADEIQRHGDRESYQHGRNSQQPRMGELSFDRRADEFQRYNDRNVHRPRIGELSIDRRADEIQRHGDGGISQHGRNSHRPRMGELPSDRKGELPIGRMGNVAFERLRIVWLLRMAENGRDLQTPVILRYFKEPPTSAYPIDLMEGFESFVHPPEVHNDLVRLEKYLMQDKSNEASGSSALTFCTQRSCLLAIFKMGLSKKLGFTVFATKVQNRIYMMKKEHEFEAGSKYPSMKIRINTFADSPHVAADPQRIANECEQTFAIYHAKFGKYELLYSGQVDGIKADEPVKDITDMEEINKCQFVRVRLAGDRMSAYWAQGYLSNSDHIYVAAKDKEKIVHQPLVHKTRAEIQQKYGFSSSRCCSSLADSLDFIAKAMANVNCPYTVYEFKFGGADPIEYRAHEDKNELSFLSEEFIQFLNK